MSYNILIVDDSPIIRSVVRKSLHMSGLDIGELFEARDGVEALNQLDNSWIDIVFADLNMPNMNGVEMVTRMAEDQLMGNTPVVIVSSERNQATILELESKGIAAYIKKPFRPEDLRDVVNRVLLHQDDGGQQHAD